MDPLLEARYLALLRRYRVGHKVLRDIKAELLRSVRLRSRRKLIRRRQILRRRRWKKPKAMQEQVLRADAALCLLALYDQMIARPYAQQVGLKLRVPEIGRDSDEFSERVLKSFDQISKQLMRLKERPVSSHQVLRVIDRTWRLSAQLFGWG
jgi:hypothetical protein